MIDDKMCIGVNSDNIMLRCEKEETDDLLKMKGAKVFDLSGGWIMVGTDGSISNDKDLDWWLAKAIEGNKNASVTKKKK